MLFSLDTGTAICAYLYNLHFFFLSKQAAFERGYAKGCTFPYQRVHLSLPKGTPFPAIGALLSCMLLRLCISRSYGFLFLYIRFGYKIVQTGFAFWG